MKDKILNLFSILMMLFTIGCYDNPMEDIKTCGGYQNELYATAPDSILFIRTLNMMEQDQYFRIYKEKGIDDEFTGEGINSINKSFKFTIPSTETNIYKTIEDMFTNPYTILDYQDPYACHSADYLDGLRTKIILSYDIGMIHPIHYIKNLDHIFEYIMDNLVPDEPGSLQ